MTHLNLTHLNLAEISALELKGAYFYDLGSQREMMLIAEGEPYADWLCYRHPDGHWVTLRKATDDDRKRIAKGTYYTNCPMEIIKKIREG